MIPLLPRTSRQRAAVYRSISRLYSSGFPPVQAAALLESMEHGADGQPVAAAFAKAMASGGVPSRELAHAGLPASHVAVIAAGEATGRVDVVLDRLAEACEHDARLSAQAWRLALEPLMGWFLLATIVPLGTLLTSGLGAYLRVGVPLLVIPPLVFWAIRGASARGVALPGFVEVARLNAVGRFCRTVALLSGAGLPMTRTLRDAAEAADEHVVKARALQAAQDVERGASLNAALRTRGVLRPVEVALVADGEATGRLDVAFRRAADLLEHEALLKARWRIRVVGAAMFMALAVTAAVLLARALATARVSE